MSLQILIAGSMRLVLVYFCAFSSDEFTKEYDCLQAANFSLAK